MVDVTGIQLEQNGKIYYFESNGLTLNPGDYVIADTSRGMDLGEVVIGNREAEESSLRSPLRKIIRLATEQDIQHSTDNRSREREAYSICQKKIAEHQLDMKLVSVEYAFDNSKILFYFTANGRVDFRSLVKDLASVFKMRIELRQIGVRDEARMLGGLGPCGRPICCGSFLSEFQPVSIKMAKEQNLSLNPTKISGVCGRLMCCLKYEQDHYEQTRKKMPRVGREVITPDGAGPVTDLNILKETVSVRITVGDASEIREYPLDQITRPQQDSGIGRNVPAARPAPAIVPEAQEAAEAADPEDAEDTVDPEVLELISDDEVVIAEETKPLRGDRRSREKKPRPQGASEKLGKPVRRENPNKKPQTDMQPQGEESEPASAPGRPPRASRRPPRKDSEARHDDQRDLRPAHAPEAKPAAPSAPAAESAPRKSSWAEAVRQAMDAIK